MHGILEVRSEQFGDNSTRDNALEGKPRLHRRIRAESDQGTNREQRFPDTELVARCRRPSSTTSLTYNGERRECAGRARRIAMQVLDDQEKLAPRDEGAVRNDQETVHYDLLFGGRLTWISTKPRYFDVADSRFVMPVGAVAVLRGYVFGSSTIAPKEVLTARSHWFCRSALSVYDFT
jgi:hypothetical protein